VATIKVINNYEIEIDKNKDHEAKEFIKMYVNPNDPDQKEMPMYRSIGHYSNVANSLNSILKDMSIQKAEKSDCVTVKEWILIIKESEEEMKNIIISSGVN